MPILATIQVDDEGTEVVTKFGDALADLPRRASGVTNALDSLTGSSSRSTNALDSLAGSQKVLQGTFGQTVQSASQVVQSAQAIVQANSQQAQAAQQVVQASQSVAAAQQAQAQVAQQAATQTLASQQQVAQSFRDTTTAVISATQQTTSSLQQQSQVLQQSSSSYNAGTSAVKTYLEQIGAGLQIYQQSQAQITLYTGALVRLSTELQKGVTADKLQADALAEVYNNLVQLGVATPQQAQKFEQLVDSISKGVPVTKEQADALEELTVALHNQGSFMSQEGKNALDIYTATERQVTQEIRNHQAALESLSKTLQTGSQVTGLQKEALRQLAQQMQTLKGFTDADKQALEAVADSLVTGQRVTKEQAAAIEALSDKYKQAAIDAGVLAKEQDTATSGMERFRAGTLAVIAVLGTLAAATFGLLKDSGELAARVETLGQAQQISARNHHIAAGEMAQQEEVIKKLGITTVDAKEATLSFASAYLKLSDASKLARAAQDLAVVTGRNSSDTFNTLTNAIESQSTMALRSVGIVRHLSEILGEYALKTNQTTRELDENERKQAILNAILKEGTEVAGAYERSLGTVGKQMGSFKRYVEESQLALGKGLLPIMTAVVATATEVLKIWLALPEPFQRAVTAILATVAALTALTTVIKLLAFLEVGALFSGWPLAIMAVAGALGLLTGAWSAYHSTQQESVTAISDQIIKLDAQRMSLQELRDKYVELEPKAKNGGAAQAEFAKTTREIAEVAPSAAQGIDKVTGAYRIQLGVLDQLIAKTEEQRQAYIITLQQRRSDVEQQLREARAQEDAATRQVNALKAQGEALQNTLAPIQKNAVQSFIDQNKVLKESENGFDRFASLAGRPFAIIAEYSGMAGKQMGQLQREAGEAFTSTLKHSNDLERELNDLNRTISDLTKTPAQSMQEMVQDAKSLADSLGVNLNAAARKAKVSLDSITGSKNLEEARSKALSLTGAIKQLAEEAQHRTATVDQAYKSTLESLQALTPAEIGRYRAINDALKSAKGNQEEYTRILIESQAALSKFATVAPEALRRKFTEVTAAAEQLKAAKLDQELKKWADQAAAAEKALAQTANTIGEKFGADLQGILASFDEKWEDRSVDVANRIDEVNRDLYERSVLGKKSEVEQLIYQNNRYYQDQIKRNNEIIRQIRAEVDAEERAIRDKADAYRRDINNIVERERIRFDTVTTTDKKLDEFKEALKNKDVRRQQEIVDDFKTTIEAYRNAALSQVDAIEEAGLKEVRARRQTAEATIDVIRDQNERIKDVNQRTNSSIIEDYRRINVVAKEIWVGIANAAAEGFTSILAGAQSLQDALTNIWNRIKNAVFGVLDSILKKWIENAAKMATQQGGFSVSGFLQGLMGKGQGQGGTDYSSLIGKVAGMFGKSGNLVNQAGVGSAQWQAAAGMKVGGASTGAAAGMSTVQVIGGGAAGGVVGGTVGYNTGKNTGSYAGGALSGAGSGAAAGFMYGGPYGALIGAGIGAIAGLFGARKNREEAQKLKEEYIKAKGGLQEFNKVVSASDRKLLDSAKTMKQVQGALKQIENGIQVTNLQKAFIAINGGMEALSAKAKQAGIDISKALAPGKSVEETQRDIELAASKLNLADAAGGLANLRKQAQLVGFDLRKAFDASTIEEFNIAQQELNALLEKQQQRLEALQDASEGLKARAEALVQSYTRDIQGAFDSFSKGTQDRLKKMFEKAREVGFTGTLEDMVAKNWNNSKIGLTAKQIEQLKKIVDETGASFNRVGLYATATFAGVLKETGDLTQAIQAVAPALDVMLELQKNVGFQSEGAAKNLLSLYKTIKDNEDVANALSGINQILRGLTEAGALTKETFDALGKDAVAQFEKLKERGVDMNQALLMMQPTLQALYEAQKNFGLQVDDSTQKLIDQGKEAGLVGDQFQSVNQKMLDILVIIAKTLGADIPAALDNFSQAGTNAANNVRTGFEDLDNTFDGNKKRILEILGEARKIGPQFKESFNLPEDQWKSVADEVRRALKEGTTGKFAPEFIENLKDQLKTIGPTAEATFTSLVEEGMSADQALRSMGPAFQTVVDVIRASGVEVGGVLGELVKNANAVDEAFRNIDLSKFSGAAREAILSVNRDVKQLGAEFVTSFDLPEEQWKTVTDEIQNALKEGVKGDFAPEFIENLKKQLKTIGPAADEAFKQLTAAGLTTEQTFSILGPAFQTIVDTVRASGVEVGGVLGQLVDQANEAAGGIGGSTDGLREKWIQLREQMEQYGSKLDESWPTWRDDIIQVGEAGDVARGKLLEWLQQHEQMNLEMPPDWEDWRDRIRTVGGAAGDAKDDFDAWLQKHNEMNGQIPGDLTEWHGDLKLVRDGVREVAGGWSEWIQREKDLQRTGLPTKIKDIDGALGGVRDRLRDSISWWEKFGRVAQENGRKAEEAATGAAEGHSPTGIKQIIFRLNEAQEKFKIVGNTARDILGSVEGDAAAAGDALTWKKNDDFVQWMREQEAARAEAEQTLGGSFRNPFRSPIDKRDPDQSPGGTVGSSPAPAPPPPPQINITVGDTKVEIKIEAVDGPSVDRIWNEELRDRLEFDLTTNRDQLATLIAQEVAKLLPRQ